MVFVTVKLVKIIWLTSIGYVNYNRCNSFGYFISEVIFKRNIIVEILYERNAMRRRSTQILEAKREDGRCESS